MQIGPLTIMKRGFSNAGPSQGWVIAAWHWRRSITWRWVLWWFPSWKFWEGFIFSVQENMWRNET